MANPRDPLAASTLFQRSKKVFDKMYNSEVLDHKTFRTIEVDVVSFWSLGPNLAQLEINLYKHFGQKLKTDFKNKLTIQLSQSMQAKNRHRLDVGCLDMQKVPLETELNAMHADRLLPLLYVCLMPTQILGNKETAFEPLVMSLITDEIGHLLETIQPHLANTETYLSNYETVTREWFMAMREIDKTLQTMEWWVGEWYPIKPKTKDILGYQTVLNVILNKAPTGLNMYGIWTLWTPNREKKYFHSSHLIRDKEQVMKVERNLILPASAVIQRLLDPPVYDKRESSFHPKIELNDANKGRFIPFRRPTPKTPAASFNALEVEQPYADPEDNDQQPCEEEKQQLLEERNSPVTIQEEIQPSAPLAQLTTSSGAHNNRPSNSQHGQRPQPVQRKKGACDAAVLRDTCYADSRGTCPYSHAKTDIAEARRKYLEGWKTDKSGLSTLANMDLLAATFGRHDVVDRYPLFEANADSYQAKQNLNNINAAPTKGNDELDT